MAVNADESEPGTFKDRYLIDYDPHSMLEGIAIASIGRSEVVWIHVTHGGPGTRADAYARWQCSPTTNSPT